MIQETGLQADAQSPDEPADHIGAKIIEGVKMVGYLLVFVAILWIPISLIATIVLLASGHVGNLPWWLLGSCFLDLVVVMGWASSGPNTGE